jgi:hypothetical protein
MRLVDANLQPVWLDGRAAAPSRAMFAPAASSRNFRTTQAAVEGQPGRSPASEENQKL